MTVVSNKNISKLTSILILISSFVPIPSSALETSVDIKARADYSFNRRHPAILGKCWGKDDENSTTNFEKETDGNSVSGNSGQQSFAIDMNGLDAGGIEWSSPIGTWYL